MKIVIISLSIFFIISCRNELVYENANFSETKFVSNSPRSNNSYTLDIKYDAGVVTATRLDGPIQVSAPSNALFIQADVAYRHDGSFDLKGQKDIWFIPFNVGTPVENITDKKYLSYYCACGRSPLANTACVAKSTSTMIACESQSGDCEDKCLGWSITLDCGSGQMIDGSPGGVIVKAKSVIVIDPAWYDPASKQTPLIFTAIEPEEPR